MENNWLKVGLEKFDGKKSFMIWKVRMEDLLVQMRLDSALKDRLKEMTKKEWVFFEKRTYAQGFLVEVRLVVHGEECVQ